MHNTHVKDQHQMENSFLKSHHTVIKEALSAIKLLFNVEPVKGTRVFS